MNQQQSNKLSFKGQVFFIGIDVHKKSWTVTIRLNGMQLKTFTMEPSAQKLKNFLSKNYPDGHYLSVYEAGFSGYWLHHQLKELGIHNIVVSPADVPLSNKEKSYKDDAIDSRKLARELENNSLQPVYVPNPKQSSTRQISRLYALEVNEIKRIKLRIKSFLNYLGIEIPIEIGNRWSNRLISWLEKLDLAQEEDRYYLDQLIKNMKEKRKEILATLRYIRETYSDNEIVKRLRTVPGIGLITAFTFYAEIMDMRRFPNENRLAAYVGLIPSIKSSGDKKRIRGINYRQNKVLKLRIIESAWVAVKNDPALTSSYMKYLKRMSKQKAIIKISRKLLNRIRSIWLNQKDYQIGREL